MYEYIIPTLVVVLPSAGFIAGALFAASRARDELAELQAWKASVLSGLNKSAAARKSKRLEREAQERLISQARHKELRANLGTAELV